MTDPEIQFALDRLKEFAGHEYGDQKKLDEQLDLPKQRVSEYLRGVRLPNLTARLKIKAFLRKHPRRNKAPMD